MPAGGQPKAQQVSSALFFALRTQTTGLYFILHGGQVTPRSSSLTTVAVKGSRPRLASCTWRSHVSLVGCRGATAALHRLHAIQASDHGAIAFVVVAVPQIFTRLPAEVALPYHGSFMIIAHRDAITTIKDKESAMPMSGAQGIPIVLHTTTQLAHILKAFFLEHSTQKFALANPNC